MNDRHLLSSVEAARLLGVSPSSVKRWADSGALPCVKTPGRHRRFERETLERFASGHSATATAGPPQAGPRAQRWLELLLGTEPLLLVEAELHAERARLGSWWRVASSLTEVLEAIGQRWRSGELSILEEHAASERLSRTLARCAESLGVSRSAPHCLLLTATGDDHTLGLSLCELCLREAGWNTRWAGRSTPLGEVLARVSARAIQMVAVSGSAASIDTGALALEARALETSCAAAGVTLVLGGQAHWPEDLEHAHRVRSFEDFHELLARLAA